MPVQQMGPVRPGQTSPYAGVGYGLNHEPTGYKVLQAPPAAHANLVRVLDERLAQKLTLRRIVRDLEAAQELVEGV